MSPNTFGKGSAAVTKRRDDDFSLPSICWHSVKYLTKKPLSMYSLSSVTLGKTFTECFSSFAQYFRHSAKKPFQVVSPGLPIYIHCDVPRSKECLIKIFGHKFLFQYISSIFVHITTYINIFLAKFSEHRWAPKRYIISIWHYISWQWNTSRYF